MYLILHNLEIFQDNISLLEKIRLFTNENIIVYEAVLSKLKQKERFALSDLDIDNQLLDKIFKFASIKHILKNIKNDEEKLFELLNDLSKDLKHHELELRIEELESKFSKDLSESTFNEIKELKKMQNIN